MNYDVAIVGGGPAGLAAALILGRARKRVLVCDEGPPRNAAAVRIQGFVTQDGTPPAEFRRIGRAQLATYPAVHVKDERVAKIEGEKGRFRVALAGGTVEARRVLLATGMVDMPMPFEGFREWWGKGIFQCPYCHGWEYGDRTIGFFAVTPETLPFALFVQSWSKDLVAFTNGAYEVAAELRARLGAAGVRIEERKIMAFAGHGEHLNAVVVEGGAKVPVDIVFARPDQRQTDLVASLGLALDDGGYVKLDEQRQTSRPGIFAGGDLTTMLQSAIIAAAGGSQAAYMLNHTLTMDLAMGQP